MYYYIVIGRGSSGLTAAAFAMRKGFYEANVFVINSAGGSVGGNESEIEKMTISLGKLNKSFPEKNSKFHK